MFGSSTPGTSVMAAEVIGHSIPILMLIAIGIMLWRDYESAVAKLYAVAAFGAIPFSFAAYFGREVAGYPVSPLIHALLAIWLLACGLITSLYVHRLNGLARRNRMTIIKTTMVMRSAQAGEHN